ncbi:MAG: hypothetical protein FWF44_07855 [Defluviitaleaceae bacterium]|nr:hypothetical protein [Defluviitaleaceae bacterium]
MLLSSCKASDTNASTTLTSVGSSSLSESTTAAEIKPNLPAEDYGGYNFRVLDNGTGFNSQWFSRDIYAESENGDTINDAVFKRNAAVEDEYNVKITDIPQTDPAAYASKSIKAGGDDFDLMEASLEGCEVPLAQQGMFYDLKTVPNIELNQVWWDQNANAGLSIKDHLYCTISNLTIIDKDATWAIMFDKNLIKSYGLDDPYQLVANNQWTLQKMYEMMKAVAKDLDGDGTMTDADQYGLNSQYRNTTHFFNAAGQFIATKDSADIPQITMMDNPAAAQILDLIYQIQTDPATINCDNPAWLAKYPGDDVWNVMQLTMFSTDRALFMFAGMNRITLLRGMDADFGVLPTPKYDSSQTRYYVPLDTWCTTAAALPKTISDINRSTIILEALTAESQYTLLPAYYDVSLKTKLTRDTQSGEMIDLILANRSYDLGRLYNWGGLATAMDQLATKSSDTFASDYAKMQSAAQSALGKTIAEYDQYAN